MKRFKFFSILFCCMAAIGLTSCLSDDNDNGLTPEERQQAYLTVAGTYTANVIYYSKLAYNGGDKNDLDTLQAGMKVSSDSTMEFSVPSKAIFTQLKDGTLAKAIVAQNPNTIVQASIGFYSLSPVAFLVNPQTVDYTVTNQDGSKTKVRVAFAGNYNSSYGAYNSSEKSLGVQLIVTGVYLNDKFNDNVLTTPVPLMFIGKRG